MKKENFKIEGMHCASCSAVIQRALNKKDGVRSAYVNLTTEQATVEYDEISLKDSDIIGIVRSKGYGAMLDDKKSNRSSFDKTKEMLKLKKKLIGSALFTLPVFILGMFFMNNPIPYQNIILWILSTPVQFYFGRDFYKGSYNSLKGGSANMDVLIALGTSAAYFYSVVIVLQGGQHQYFEAAAVIITLVLLGKYLEMRAKGKTSQAIAKLINLSPKKATKIVNGKEVQILVDDVQVGDILVVRPGEKLMVFSP